jgi:hypothetical protein
MRPALFPKILTVSLVSVLVFGAPERSWAQSSSDPEAERLVDRWIEALGGMENYRRLETARFVLTTEMYDAESGRLRRTRPRYVWISKGGGERGRIERWEGDDFIVQGFDGESEWAYTNGEPLSPGQKDRDQVRYVVGDVNYWIALPFKLKDPGVYLHYDGRDDQGRHIVRVTFGEDVGDHQDTWHYFFRDGQTWPVQVDYQEAGKTNVNHTRWEDIQTVGGYHFAASRVYFDEAGRVVKIIRTQDFELNPEIDSAVFGGPDIGG